MRFLILGPLEVHGEDGALPLGGIKPRAVLAVLLLHANEPVSAERLALALWGDDAPAEATKTVQVHVWRLRKALGDEELIATTPGGYCLRVDSDALDAAWFERLTEDGRLALADGRPEHAGRVLREALRLWRGPALAELAGEPFAGIEIARLEEQRSAALELRIDADLASGRHAELVGELRRLAATHPKRERLAAQLMLTLYRCGRQTDALEAYQVARHVLVTDVGVEPGPRLRELQQAILRHDAALDWGGRGTGLNAATVALALPRSLHVGASSPFVGRDTELARLRERWAAVEDGARSAVVIGGEAGIGKTRLAAELAVAVHAEGGLVLYGRCDEGLAVPYQPFVEALRPYISAVGLDRIRAELGPLAPQLRRLLPELAELGKPARGDLESERYALFDAVSALLDVATGEQPALLVLDDLHWAAGPTLLLMRHLIRSERPLRALVLGTLREWEVAPADPRAQVLADLQRDISAARVSIGGLDEQAIAALLEAASGHALDEQAAELVALVRSQTGGNSLFVREYLAHLRESGLIDSPGRHRTSDLRMAELRVPEGLRDVIRHRVARLSEPTRRALTVASVAGPTFSAAVLQHVLDDESGMLDALDEAVAAGLLTATGPADYAFAHALVHQALYSELSSIRRMRLHRQLGETIEALYHPGAHVDALAHHFAKAAADGQQDKAADYALAAGRGATARLGYEEAAAHYERGLEALVQTGQADEERRCELLFALSEVRWSAGQLDKARDACTQAAELAECLGDGPGLARAALGFAGPPRLEPTAGTAPFVDLFERALAALGEDESALRARLMGSFAGALGSEGLARQALDLARQVGETTTLAHVIAATYWATKGPDGLDEHLAAARELARLAASLCDGRLAAQAQYGISTDLLEAGDVDASEDAVAALERLAEALQQRYPRWLAATARARQTHLEGRLEAFEGLAHDARALALEGQDEFAAVTYSAQIAVLRSEQGRAEDVVEAMRRLCEQEPEVLAWRCALASSYAQCDRAAEARRELDALSGKDFSDLPRDRLWLTMVSLLCEVVAFLGDAPRAAVLYELLLPYAGRCAVITTHCRGSAWRPLGLLAGTMSRFDDAARHFEEAIRINTRIRSPLWVAHTRHDYARVLLRRNGCGDPDKALELLNEALATAEQLGLKALADKARPLKLAAQAAAHPPALTSGA